MGTVVPEKARLLEKLTAGGFNVPPFIYLTPDDFENRRFEKLEAFLAQHCGGYKVIARSAHPKEEEFKSGTFDSFGTYADVGGVQYARKKMIRMADTTKRLSIQRQQVFNHAPQIDLNQMGVIVMPFIEGTGVMAKMLGNQWEFGYCRDRARKIQNEPYITQVPHDRRLVQLSRQIQEYLGFRCEIEFIVSQRGSICVVQAKDISHIETLEQKESERCIRLDGLRRVRKRRNYRERPLYVVDNKAFYINLIGQCEDMLLGCTPGQVSRICWGPLRHMRTKWSNLHSSISATPFWGFPSRIRKTCSRSPVTIWMKLRSCTNGCPRRFMTIYIKSISSSPKPTP